ncbi:MAG: peptidoglycan DD-metalloendopeptidase family protein [Alphaproteobacteria bacterium]|nr:peptidoglycan DD-metalloendopeptidase family protein [Alphaproteobacteria bacterium]HPF45977.1 peptidoglycan DD-metalloendopeptidase family protein [Emcibacteraceae bacterium]
MLLLSVTVAFVTFVQPTFSQIRTDKEENSERLDQLRKQIEESSEKAETYEEEALAIRREVQKIQEQLIKSAAEIQATEDQILAREANLKELRAKEIELEKNLKQKNFEMASTLGAMERLSIQRTSVVAFRPNEAINTLRTTALLKVILPDLKNRAGIIEDDLSDLNKVRDDITQENIELKNDLTKLVISNNEIDVLLKKRVERQKNLELSTKQERDKLKTFAENAKDLQDLLSKIEREIALREEAARRAEEALRDKPTTSGNKPSLASIPMPDGGADFASAKGNLPLPVRGSIDQIYDQMLSTGQRSKGIVVDTLAGATVIAPHEGRIVYAGKFRSYGQLLIISHGEGYHTLLAGMENINGIVGQWVLKGEPIGQMSSDTGQSNSRQKLYVELRLKGKPINPLPWIVAMDRGGK